MEQVEATPRAHTGPLLAGDQVGGRRIEGFAFRPGTEDPSGNDDHVLFDGDRDSPLPPHRPASRIGATGVDVILSGASRARDRWAASTKVAPPGLPEGADRIVHDPARPWSGVARALLDDLSVSRAELWLVGGAVRDVLLGSAADVNDLDFAGTAPAGHFFERADRVVGRSASSDLRVKVTDGVVSIRGSRSGDPPLVDYRPLHQDGFRFPASGGDLGMDVVRRDLTINCLYYDAVARALIDPTGRGLDDLVLGGRPVLAPVAGPKDAATTAVVILRAIRMLIRWTDLPAENCLVLQGLDLDAETMREIRIRSGMHLDGATGEDVREAVSRLAHHDSDLLDRLLESLRA
jgi:hypothetical protein